MTKKDLVLALASELEALGCDPEVCGACGAFKNWEKTPEADPIAAAQSDGALINDLFCLCG